MTDKKINIKDICIECGEYEAECGCTFCLECGEHEDNCDCCGDCGETSEDCTCYDASWDDYYDDIREEEWIKEQEQEKELEPEEPEEGEGWTI